MPITKELPTYAWYELHNARKMQSIKKFVVDCLCNDGIEILWVEHYIQIEIIKWNFNDLDKKYILDWMLYIKDLHSEEN